MEEITIGQLSELANQLKRMLVTRETFNVNLLAAPGRMEKLARIILEGKDFDLGEPMEIEIDGVKYHHHSNGGGLVAETAYVAPTVEVGPRAMVAGKAQISDKVHILDLSLVDGNANLSGGVIVEDFVHIGSNANVSGGVYVNGRSNVIGGNISGYTAITGSATVKGGRIFGSPKISGNTEISDNVEICGRASIGSGVISGSVKISGDVNIPADLLNIFIAGNAVLMDSVSFAGNNIRIYGEARLFGDRVIKSGKRIYK